MRLNVVNSRQTRTFPLFFAPKLLAAGRRCGPAVPEIDEIAGVALDLWAMKHGCAKLQTNVFGL